jgi:hypothetical protein
MFRVKPGPCCRCHKIARACTRTGLVDVYCRPCRNLRARNKYRAHKERTALIVRRSEFKTRYGITLDDKERMFNLQGRKCAACGSVDVGFKPKKHKFLNPWHMDHNHKTKQVRGVLCYRCNFTIGNAQESVIRLRGCADYLEKHAGEGV